MEKHRNQSRRIGGLNELDSVQWTEYWQLKMQNDADARRDFWRSLITVAGIIVPVFVCLCFLAK